MVNKRNGTELLGGSTEIQIGKLKSATSRRDVPLKIPHTAWESRDREQRLAQSA